MKRRIGLAVLGMTFISATLGAEDWPRWLGPRGDNISKEANLAQSFPAEGPKKLWSAKVGIGYASPVAAGGKIYMFTTESGKDTLTCLDAEKGTEIWKQSYDGAFTGAYPGTRSSPFIEGKFIYTYGGAGDLVCRQLDDGKLVWRTSILKEIGGKNQQWGISSGPAVVGDVIYVQGGVEGPAAAAVSKADGKIIWKSQAQGGSYAFPIVIEVGSSKQVVAFGNKAIFGIDAANGKTIWEHPWETKYDVNATTPVFKDGMLLLTSNYAHGGIMLKPSASGVEKVWENKDVMSQFQPVVVDGDVIYVNSEGTLKCVNWADGKLRWAAPRGERGLLGIGGSFVRVGQQLLCLSERGKLTLLKATPEGMEKLAQADLFDGVDVWSSPLLYNQKLYIKANIKTDDKPEYSLICYEFAAK